MLDTLGAFVRPGVGVVSGVAILEDRVMPVVFVWVLDQCMIVMRVIGFLRLRPQSFRIRRGRRWR